MLVSLSPDRLRPSRKRRLIPASPRWSARVRDIRPNQFLAKDATNAGARIQALSNIAGTPESIEELQAARDGTALPMLHSALANSGKADASPVVDQIDSILASPAGQRDAVTSNLNSLRSKLVDGAGNVQSDPAQLYGIRQSIGDALSPSGGAHGLQRPAGDGMS